MPSLKRSTSRRDKPKRSRSALSRLPDSWLDDNVNLVRRTPKVGYVIANRPCVNKHYEPCYVNRTSWDRVSLPPVGDPTWGATCTCGGLMVVSTRSWLQIDGGRSRFRTDHK